MTRVEPPLEHTSPTWVLVALANEFKKDSPVKSDIAKLFIETTYIFSVIMGLLESDDFIEQILKKVV